MDSSGRMMEEMKAMIENKRRARDPARAAVSDEGGGTLGGREE